MTPGHFGVVQLNRIGYVPPQGNFVRCEVESLALVTALNDEQGRHRDVSISVGLRVVDTRDVVQQP
jgi:hypothetical protein